MGKKDLIAGLPGVQVDILWIMLIAALVFVMQAGFLCLESGLTRHKEYRKHKAYVNGKRRRGKRTMGSEKLINGL
ncbi:MAG: hypothetical protein ACI9FD_004754 [Gammaproteobacteria bacterium]|jgi:hypothetical protein